MGSKSTNASRAKKNGKRYPSIDPAKRRKHGGPTSGELARENEQLKRELRQHQRVLAVLCLRDGRVRCDARELEALEGYRHGLKFRDGDDGELIVDHYASPMPRPAATA